MIKNWKSGIIVFLLVSLSGCGGGGGGEEVLTLNVPTSNGLSNVIGSTHVQSGYYFGNKDSLNEGADQLLAMGTKVIKVWFYNGVETPDKKYPWNSTWSKVDNLVDGAKLPYWKELFDKPFTTFILQTMAMNREQYYWLTEITEEDEANETEEFYQLTKYLLTKYQNTGKTFVLSNHESDWHIPIGSEYEQSLRNMIKWAQARQDGVTKAQKEIGMYGVNVFHAIEVANVMKSMHDREKTVVNSVIPYVKLDLVSYSSWDLRGEKLTETLDYISEQAQESPFFGRKQIFVGEFGIPEYWNSTQSVLQRSKEIIKQGLEWGCPYIVYWQLYCNEPRPGVDLPSFVNNDFYGFWLVRADGSKTELYNYLKILLHN